MLLDSDHATIDSARFRIMYASLLIDGTGPVKIKYPNNLVRGTAMIFVNGFSFSNQVGSSRCSYKVQ
jgi:hypothetical protein